MLQEVVLDGSYNFEGSSSMTQRVYGLSYEGQLVPAIGAPRLQTSASDCFIHSDANTFLTITKENCSPTYQCVESVTAASGWIVELEICPTDGVDDIVPLANNLFIPPGQNYAYLITDENEIVQEAVLDSLYNFENSGEETQRIYGVNYDGTLDVAIGQHRTQTTATGCFFHSQSNFFLTIFKTGCEEECLESGVATENWVLVSDICSTDGTADEIVIKTNIDAVVGEDYAFLITDENQILQEVLLDSIYNFEGTGIAQQRVYGVSYSGNLDPKIGEIRTNTSASDCFIHSSDNLFLTINKTTACATTAVNNPELTKLIKIFPNPAEDFVTIELPSTFVPEQISVINMLGMEVMSQVVSSSDNIQIDIQNLTTGNYFIRIENKDEVVNQKIQIH